MTLPLPHPSPLSGASYSAAELSLCNERVFLLDQRRLPEREYYVEAVDANEVAGAIRDMVVRGAPAIGIAAAYGLALAARRGRTHLLAAAAELRRARPTAVNLAWAVNRVLTATASTPDSELWQEVAEEARRIHREDVEANRRMGELGAASIPRGSTVLTHCNAGALATGGFGTALGVIRAAHRQGKVARVFADETRPWLQGARLTAWELHRDGIPVTVIGDSSAASFFAKGQIDAVVVGSDRIAANGDVANKIGTYGVACLAERHGCPFYVAAPWSTVDLQCPSGADIPIEMRPETEVTHFRGQRITPEGVAADNPSFDVTPAALVTAIFTERGVVQPVDTDHLARTGSGT